MDQNKNTEHLNAKAAYLREMRPYHLSAEKLIDDMVKTSMITREESYKRRSMLLATITEELIIEVPDGTIGQQLSPAVEAASLGLPGPKKSAPYAPAVGLSGAKVPGDRPITGVALTPVVDDEGFCSARSIAEALGNAIKPVIVGKMSRALGIFGRADETAKNEWGFFLPLEQNNNKVADNWRYSKKSQAILMATLMKYVEIKRSSSKNIRAGEVISQVVETTSGYPLPPMDSDPRQEAQPN